ncbi:10144_t:CDS:2, partial [Rhizophagus irregularis]
MIHTAIYARVWDDAPCKVIGALNWAFLTINLCFYAVIAVITYLRVCREIYFHYGKYDYKLWVYVLTGSAALQVLNLQNNGKRDYWCAAKSGQINSAIILFSTIGIVLIVILFCYLSILRKIHNHTEIERRAAKKILSYTAMFMLQWIPMLISQGARLVK